ncbi:MAG: polymerase sigma factor [Microbacterium sp.]|nr:polymerase sigma factor [Microbacterium sp.]
MLRLNIDDLLAYTERRVSLRADAADILGDAIETMWRHVAKVPAAPVEARMWMYTVVRNTMLNARRSSKRRTAAFDRLRVELERVPPPLSTDERLDLHRAMNTLPPDPVELVRLVHWDGFSITEAAALVDIPPSTARTRFAKARHLLKQELSAHASTNPHH